MQRTTAPRAHWVVLVVVVVVVLAAVVVDGVVNGYVGRAATNTVAKGARAPLADAGPILQLDAGRWRSVHLPPRTVALTFDDGPDPQWTPQILAALHRAHVPATFFVVGARVLVHPDLVAAEWRAGNDVGVHTFTHPNLADVPAWRRRAELDITQSALGAAFGRHSVLMRPPYSSEPDAVTPRDLTTLADIARDGYIVVLTDRDGEDWHRDASPEGVVNDATPLFGAGGVVLLHDAGGNREATVRAIPLLVARLRASGYRFVTISQAAGLSRPAAFAPMRGHDRWRSRALLLSAEAATTIAHAFRVLVTIVIALMALRAVVLLEGAYRHTRRRRNDLLAQPPITVIVPAYNESAGIAASVWSLLASDYPALKVVVVDDGSTDDTAEIVEAIIEARIESGLDARVGSSVVATAGAPALRLVRQANAGKAAALNHGLTYTTDDIVVTIDGDTLFEPDTVAALVRGFGDERVGAVSGNTKVRNRRSLLGQWQHLEYVMGLNLDRRALDLVRAIPTVPGAVGAYRRTALDAIGGFTDDTLAEDTDLTIEIQRAGYDVVYRPDAIAWTEAPSSLHDLWRQRYRWCYGTLQSLWKHRRAVLEHDERTNIGRIGIPYLALFQVALPIVSPLIDVCALAGLLFVDTGTIAVFWVAFTLLQVALAARALRLDGESRRALWSLPFQTVVYRQLMYLVVTQSVVTALLGARLGWHKLHRIGTGDTALAGTATPAGDRVGTA